MGEVLSGELLLSLLVFGSCLPWRAGQGNCTNESAKPTFVGWKSTQVDFATW